MLVYLFLYLGSNAELFSNNTTVNWISLILGTIAIYTITIGAIKNLTNIEIGFVSYKFSSILFALIIPISIFCYNYFRPKDEPIKYTSLLDKENIVFVVNNSECSKVKYGTFTNGTDTIVRFIRDGKNYELTKLLNKETLFEIKWLDSCSYAKIKKNNSLIEYIRLGNFDNDTHYKYTKPGHLHNIDKEHYEMIITVD